MNSSSAVKSSSASSSTRIVDAVAQMQMIWDKLGVNQTENGPAKTPIVQNGNQTMTTAPLTTSIENATGPLARSLQASTASDNVNLTAELLRDCRIGETEDKFEGEISKLRKRRQLKVFKESLPIYAKKDELLRLVKNNQVTVVVGATGSGKSTQITQYLVEAGYGSRRIGCTQPRRVAASSLATRVALEHGTTVGDKVGYKIRFENCSSSDTIIKYMTDGVLVTEFTMDQKIEDYSFLILDEAHERSIHTDVVLGLLKLCLPLRPDLKVIVTSATLDSDKFSGYFGNAPILNIPGRGFPVKIEYSAVSDSEYIPRTVTKVMEIYRYEPEGDILVFLPGQEEIEQAWDQLYDQVYTVKCQRPSLPDMLILPFYSSLPPEDLRAVSDPTPPGVRKVILATNIAETSLTIDNIQYIVDPGFEKHREFNPKSGIDSLVVKRITKAQAVQRAGRTGRTGPGTVYRLYSEYTYMCMHDTPIPEIMRSNVEAVILQLAFMGIVDILKFPFIDPPHQESVLAAMEYLLELQALRRFGGTIEMTPIGRKMAHFPLDPTLAKVLIKSSELGCSEEILTIVSILSAQNTNVFVRPKKKRVESDLVSAKFRHKDGDHLTLLNVHKAWKNNGCSENWCKQNFVNAKVLEEADEIRKQLALLLISHDLKVLSCHGNPGPIQQALCSGFFHKVARKGVRGHAYSVYASGILEETYIFPASTMFSSAPSWVLYHEILKTKKPYMRNVIKIDPIWIKRHSPTFFEKLKAVFPDLANLC